MLTIILLSPERQFPQLFPLTCSNKHRNSNHHYLPKKSLYTHLAPQVLQLLPKGTASKSLTSEANKACIHECTGLQRTRAVLKRWTSDSYTVKLITERAGKNSHLLISQVLFIIRLPLGSDCNPSLWETNVLVHPQLLRATKSKDGVLAHHKGLRDNQDLSLGSLMKFVCTRPVC